MIIRFPVSPEQEEVIVDHLLEGVELGMQPDERAWILSSVHKMQPGAKVKSADLDLEAAEWIVEIKE